MRAHDQSSIFSIGGKFRPDCGLLLELHALTLVARSYALLQYPIHHALANQTSDEWWELARASLTFQKSESIRDVETRLLFWVYKNSKSDLLSV